MSLKVVELTSLNIDQIKCIQTLKEHFRIPDLLTYMTEDERGLRRC